ncbi:MAG: hypothetical protein ACRDP6_29215 [Actinoallomurus sp.]
MSRLGVLAAAAYGLTIAAISSVLVASIHGAPGLGIGWGAVFVGGYGMGMWDACAGGRVITWISKVQETLHRERPGRADE